MISKTSDSVTVSIKGSTYPCIKHFNPKKKLVVIGVSALLTCCGALRNSFFLGLKMFIYFMHNLDLKLVRRYSPWIQTVEIPWRASKTIRIDFFRNCRKRMILFLQVWCFVHSLWKIFKCDWRLKKIKKNALFHHRKWPNLNLPSYSALSTL